MLLKNNNDKKAKYLLVFLFFFMERTEGFGFNPEEKERIAYQ